MRLYLSVCLVAICFSLGFVFVAFILLDIEGNKLCVPTSFHYIYLETRWIQTDVER